MAMCTSKTRAVEADNCRELESWRRETEDYILNLVSWSEKRGFRGFELSILCCSHVRSGGDEVNCKYLYQSLHR